MIRWIIFTMLISIVVHTSAQERSFLTTTKSDSTGGKRLALVIGNNQYEHASTLSYTKRDAKAMEKALLEVGFDVEAGYDLDKTAFEEAIQSFAYKLANYDVGFIFYAGHAAEVDGKNYLIPTDANPRNKPEMNFQCILTDEIFQFLDEGNKPKIIVLDACRNNPFLRGWRGIDRDGSGRGLAKINNKRNSLIVYSTDPGVSVKDDNPFSRTLATRLQAGGCLDDIIRDVRREVETQDPNQSPWSNDNLKNKICFGEDTTIQDSDGDGLNDLNDKCPQEYGPAACKGCPCSDPYMKDKLGLGGSIAGGTVLIVVGLGKMAKAKEKYNDIYLVQRNPSNSAFSNSSSTSSNSNREAFYDEIDKEHKNGSALAIGGGIVLATGGFYFLNNLLKRKGKGFSFSPIMDFNDTPSTQGQYTYGISMVYNF